MQFFNIVKEIRNKNIDELSSILQEKINTFDVGINIMNEYRLRKQNKPFVRYILARITNHLLMNSSWWRNGRFAFL